MMQLARPSIKLLSYLVLTCQVAKLEKLALRGDRKISFPRPLLGRPDYDFSLSGLKTSVRYKINQLRNISSQDKADISASFQKAV